MYYILHCYLVQNMRQELELNAAFTFQHFGRLLYEIALESYL